MSICELLFSRMDEGCATSHGLKWGPLLPNEVDGFAQHVRKGEARKEGKDGGNVWYI